MTAEEARESASKLLSRLRALLNPLKCEGETEVVNLHGAFISTAIPLRVGMTVDMRVVLTGKLQGLWWSMLIVSSLGSVVSLWISHRTFGGFCCLRTTGQRMISGKRCGISVRLIHTLLGFQLQSGTHRESGTV